MKTLAIIITIWITINLLALILNLLFSNTITGTITMLLIISGGISLAIKIIKEL